MKLCIFRTVFGCSSKLEIDVPIWGGRSIVAHIISVFWIVIVGVLVDNNSIVVASVLVVSRVVFRGGVVLCPLAVGSVEVVLLLFWFFVFNSSLICNFDKCDSGD